MTGHNLFCGQHYYQIQCVLPISSFMLISEWHFLIYLTSAPTYISSSNIWTSCVWVLGSFHLVFLLSITPLLPSMLISILTFSIYTDTLLLFFIFTLEFCTAIHTCIIRDGIGQLCSLNSHLYILTTLVCYS